MTTTHRVLVALDDGEASVRAAEAVREFFGDTDVEILGINVAANPQTWVAPGLGYGMVAPVFPSATTQAAEEVAVDRAQEQAAAALSESGLEATPLGAVGEPVSAIVAAADRHDVDVIVVGGDEAGFLGRLFDQSVPRALLRDARRPVLVVPPDWSPRARSDSRRARGR
jgi:nucleotide-binding universal stress UspA family protein